MKKTGAAVTLFLQSLYCIAAVPSASAVDCLPTAGCRGGSNSRQIVMLAAVDIIADSLHCRVGCPLHY